MVKTAVSLLILFGGIYAGAYVLDRMAKKKEVKEECQCGCGGQHEEEHECCGKCNDCKCHKEEGLMEKVEETAEKVEEIIEEATEKVEEVVEEIREKIEDIIEETVDEVEEEVKELVEEVKEPEKKEE